MLREFDNGLSAHPTRLSCEVDSLTRRLGDIACSIANEGHSTDNTTGTRVLGDGVGFNFDDFTAANLF